MDKRANLKDVIAYVEGKRKASDSLSLLTSLTITAGFQACADYERCRLAEILLAKLALHY